MNPFWRERLPELALLTPIVQEYGTIELGFKTLYLKIR
jgi:hypothetical protein